MTQSLRSVRGSYQCPSLWQELFGDAALGGHEFGIRFGESFLFIHVRIWTGKTVDPLFEEGRSEGGDVARYEGAPFASFLCG